MPRTSSYYSGCVYKRNRNDTTGGRAAKTTHKISNVDWRIKYRAHTHPYTISLLPLYRISNLHFACYALNYIFAAYGPLHTRRTLAQSLLIMQQRGRPWKALIIIIKDTNTQWISQLFRPAWPINKNFSAVKEKRA